MINNNATFKKNQPVVGVYCGIKFSGFLTDARPTPDGRNAIWTVTLKESITVYGHERDDVEIWGNGSNQLDFS